jgi:hypothetical protein
MPRRIVALLAACALAVPALASAHGQPQGRGHAGAYWHQCGADHHTGAGWYRAIAHDTSCHQARRLARRWWHQNPTWGFDCTVMHRGPERGRVLCHRVRGQRVERVRFSYAGVAL